MKKLLLLLIFTGFLFNQGFTQIGKEIRTICYGDSKNYFFSKLDSSSKKNIQNLFLKYNIDTSSVIILKYDDIFDNKLYKNNLDSSNYLYYNFLKYGNINREKEIFKPNNFCLNRPKKLIVLYSYDKKDFFDTKIYYFF